MAEEYVDTYVWGVYGTFLVPLWRLGGPPILQWIIHPLILMDYGHLVLYCCHWRLAKGKKKYGEIML